MTNYDLSPLYRTIVGFDRVANLIESAARQKSIPNYPPYNIIQIGEDDYRIEIAVAGFNQSELDIETRDDLVIVKGEKAANKDETKYIHRGIAERSFEQHFRVADHVKVTGADLQNGLLVVELHREIPEAAKPRKINIGTSQLVDVNTKELETA